LMALNGLYRHLYTVQRQVEPAILSSN